MSEQSRNDITAVDQAITARLAKLRSRPVDLSQLKKALEQEIPRRQTHRFIHAFAIRPLRTVAAMLAVGITVLTLILASWSGPAMASTDDLVRLHESLVSQTTPMTNVSSMAAANAALAGKWPDAPLMPSMPGHEEMACCIHRIGKAKAACIMLSVDGTPVTMAAADSSEVRLPDSNPTTRGGTQFSVQGAKGISMVMTERNGKWYCLMGKVSPDRLMDFWNGLGK